MKLDVYRSCTWKEKRDVLEAFWSTNAEPSPRIGRAALEYGYYALVCMAVVMLEIALIMVVAINHGSLIEWISAAGELFMLWSTWWAIKRYRVLQARFNA